MREKLSNKELTFCFFFVETGNLKRALSISNIENFSKVLPRLMLKKSIREQILKDYEIKKNNLEIISQVGYEKLAFNDISDCVKLMFAKEIDDVNLNEMNLFNISEIKRLKDGTMEMKFFDRFKALDKLRDIASQKHENDVFSFYSSLKEKSEHNFSSDKENAC